MGNFFVGAFSQCINCLPDTTEEIITATICSNETYTLPSGNIVSTVGTYHDTLNSVFGCDSLVTTILSVDSIDTGIAFTEGAATAQMDNAFYQWVDCNNNYSTISGATNQDFQPQTAGSYAVIISDGTCSDTSACVFISGVNDLFISSFISVYPNPVTSIATIEYQTTQAGKSTVTVENCLGKLFNQQKSQTTKSKTLI